MIRWGEIKIFYNIFIYKKNCHKNTLSMQFTGTKQMSDSLFKKFPSSRSFAFFKVLSAKGMPFRSEQVLCSLVVAQEKTQNEPKPLGKLALP